MTEALLYFSNLCDLRRFVSRIRIEPVSMLTISRVVVVSGFTVHPTLVVLERACVYDVIVVANTVLWNRLVQGRVWSESTAVVDSVTCERKQNEIKTRKVNILHTDKDW